MNVYYCDRCGREMAGRAGDARFIAMQEEEGLQSAGKFVIDKLPSGIGTMFSLVGRPSRILHICGECGASLRTWMATP